ncbi:ATP-binding cassette domain-containing protein, partial [Actinoplanes sp. NPDC005259]
ALALLDDVGLADAAEVPAAALAYGRKRALELAVALALDPRVLLLDEPTAGMGAEDVERTIALIRTVRAGRTVVLVEHNMRVVANLADRVTVLTHGTVLVEGGYAEVRADPRVITAYLGAAHADR